jgi:ketosteroid isomerase-like protein
VTAAANIRASVVIGDVDHAAQRSLRDGGGARALSWDDMGASMISSNVKTVQAVLDAFCRGDLEVAASYFAEDATLQNNVVSDVKRGRAAIHAHLVHWYASFSEAVARDVELLDAGDNVVGIFFGEGTHTGPLGEFPPTGKRYSIKYCEIYRFGPDGLIVANEAFFDQLSLLRQLGLTP